jgi:diguanylate cyclase (GGDEF)-like protein/PAS domain S-box-containing protein
MHFEASNSFVELDGRPPLLLSIFRDVTERKDADEAIRRAKEYSENLIKNAPVMVAHLDRNGRVVSLNRTAERITGYRRDELENRNWLRLLMPRRRFPEVWQAFRRQRESSERSDFEAPLISRTGEKRIIQWSYSEVTENGEVTGLIAFGADVTEARATAMVLQRYQLLLKHASDVMLLIRFDGSIVEANDAAAHAYDFSREELFAMNIRDLHAGTVGDSPVSNYGMDGALTQAMHRRRNGGVFPVEVSSTAAVIGDEQVMICVIRDITERRVMEEELERQAFHDPLTGLANRALFMDRLAHALAGTARRRDNAAVLFLDLDRFKLINDSLGHEAGDELLVAVARRLLRCLRAEDTAARFGGDEFTILLENLADETEANHVANRILLRLAEPFELASREIRVTASIGIAFSRGACCSPEDLMRSADLAMYEAKSAGRSNFQIFHPDMNSHALERLDLETDLRRAIERHQLQLHYQPIIAMDTGRVTGVEALVRWQHPRHGLMPPSEFVPLQEQIGLSDSLTLWLLGEAWRREKLWRAEGASLTVSINLFPHHLQDDGFACKMQTALRAIGAGTDWLKMEVTESAIIAHPSRALSVLRGLDALGIALSLDDFGAGYSSIGYLKDLPIREFKIDRSLIAPLHSGGDPTVVRAAIELAHNLGREAVAEGVESELAWNTLKSLRCDAAQGYFMGPPMPADRFDAWLKSSTFGWR